MIAAFLTLFEWAAAGLAAISFLVAVQIESLGPACVALGAAGLAGLARYVALRRATGLYRDDDLLPRLALRRGGSADEGRAP